MISGGKGGGHTVTGLHFEKAIDLHDVLSSLPNYSVSDDRVFYKGQEVGRLIGKHKLYKFLSEKKVDWEKLISSKLLPDDALLVFSSNTLFILEKKFQQCEGSVDEKLQTCDFKKKQYTKLFTPLNVKVEYIYVLSEWFKDKAYKDVLEYIKSVGCKYYFEEIPLKEIGLQAAQE